MALHATAADPLEVCAQEPIRIPGSVQPHGALVLLREKDRAIVQVSSTLSQFIGRQAPVESAPSLADVFGQDFSRDIEEWLSGEEALYLEQTQIAGKTLNVSGHKTQQGIILEIEPVAAGATRTESYYPLLRRFMEQTDRVSEVSELCRMAAAQFRQLSGFDRVMIYRFDRDWNGTVIAEDGNGRLPSYLDVRFPASDIPAQARELYRLNRIRLIPTANYKSARLHPQLCPIDGKPLDLSFAALRSVSPVHLAYMRNMGAAASMSISIVIDDKLWGLVSCHHSEERYIGPQVRAACDFLGQILAQQIAARERAIDVDERLKLKRIETELIAHLARSKTFQEGLVERAPQWLGLTKAAGAAVITEGAVLTAGATPSPDQIVALADWLHRQKIEPIFSTDALASSWPAGEAVADVASGVVAVPISRVHASYIFWFRPEVVRTVSWGGDPDKEKAIDARGRLNPRNSFESWKETVRNRALPWREAELFAAVEFRNAVLDFVLQRAEERALLTEELQRINKELESFSYSVSHDLRAPFRHIVGYAQLLGEEEQGLKEVSRHYLEGIIHAALSAGQLVDDLLHFSQLGRSTLTMSRIDMNKAMAEIKRSFNAGADEIDWQIEQLPPAWGDATLVRQALFNLVDNAVKYSRDATPRRIRISGVDRAIDVLYSVEDNGVGFDMAYVGKLFQVFQRLHRPEEYEGTGIGLALTKRIVDRHGGTLEARGAIGKGALFSFSVPKPTKEKDFGDA